MKPSLASYRLRIPIALVLVALLSGIAVSVATFVLVDAHVEANAVAQTGRLARTLAGSLAQPVLRNDVWQAYQMVRAPTQAHVDPAAPTVRVVVLDVEQRVFASSDPVAFPIGMHVSSLPPRMARSSRQADAGAPVAGNAGRQDSATDSWVVAEPIRTDEDTVVGSVVVEQRRAISRAQAREIFERLALLGAIAIACIALVGWVSGRRMTAPLARLREAMQSAAESPAAPVVAEVGRRGDEIGALARAFDAMLVEVHAKRQIEREVLRAERMASIGRLAAGIAHEVNNPLGGMLNAIQNRRLRGSLDDQTDRTLGLLERAIAQIHSTLGALLNEARDEVHDLRREDLQDLYLLIHPQAEQTGCALEWSVEPPVGMRLPAVTVRQVTLNLALNAVAAAGPAGRVRVESSRDGRGWHVRVSNTGQLLTQPRLDALLRGERGTEGGRIGLGLWITARLLHQAGGELRLEPPAGLGGSGRHDREGWQSVLVATIRAREE